MITTVLALLLAAPAQAPAAAAPEEDPNEVVCRRFAETGSFVKKRRVCHTRAEWIMLNDATHEAAARWVEENRTRATPSN